MMRLKYLKIYYLATCSTKFIKHAASGVPAAASPEGDNDNTSGIRRL
jgi:hypothetical protein